MNQNEIAETTYVMSIDDHIACKPSAPKAPVEPLEVTFKEFDYWSKRIMALVPGTKVAVHFGTLVIDRLTHEIVTVY